MSTNAIGNTFLVPASSAAVAFVGTKFIFGEGTVNLPVVGPVSGPVASAITVGLSVLVAEPIKNFLIPAIPALGPWAVTGADLVTPVVVGLTNYAVNMNTGIPITTAVAIGGGSYVASDWLINKFLPSR
jgi:hypothetical protein